MKCDIITKLCTYADACDAAITLYDQECIRGPEGHAARVRDDHAGTARDET